MLFVDDKAITEMVMDAQAAFPDECCGFLFGEEEKDRIIIVIKRVNNAREGDKRRRFEIAPMDYLQAEQFAEQTGLQLLGVYHSHPGHPAIPSEQDRLAAQPYFSYIIISVINNMVADIRSWQLNDQQQFEEEEINNHHLIKNDKYGNSNYPNSPEKIYRQ